MEQIGLEKIRLEVPVRYKGDGETEVEYKELSMRRIKTKDLSLLPDSWFMEEGVKNPAGLIPLISKLAGIPTGVVEEIDVYDLMTIAEVVESFLSSSPRTGKK